MIAHAGIIFISDGTLSAQDFARAIQRIDASDSFLPLPSMRYPPDLEKYIEPKRVKEFWKSPKGYSGQMRR